MLPRRGVSSRFGVGQDAAEAGRKGGIRSGEVRREQSKSVREKLREKVEANVDQIWSAFEAGLACNDPSERRASAVAVLAEAYGRPPQAIVGDPDQPVSFVLQSAFQSAISSGAPDLASDDSADVRALEAVPGTLLGTNELREAEAVEPPLGLQDGDAT